MIHTASSHGESSQKKSNLKFTQQMVPEEDGDEISSAEKAMANIDHKKSEIEPISSPIVNQRSEDEDKFDEEKFDEDDEDADNNNDL